MTPQSTLFPMIPTAPGTEIHEFQNFLEASDFAREALKIGKWSRVSILPDKGLKRTVELGV